MLTEKIGKLHRLPLRQKLTVSTQYLNKLLDFDTQRHPQIAFLANKLLEFFFSYRKKKPICFYLSHLFSIWFSLFLICASEITLHVPKVLPLTLFYKFVFVNYGEETKEYLPNWCMWIKLKWTLCAHHPVEEYFYYLWSVRIIFFQLKNIFSPFSPYSRLICYFLLTHIISSLAR